MFERILVPIDGSATSKRGVREAIAVAKLTSARIKLMHVFERPLLGIGSESALLGTDDVYNVARDAGRALLSDAAASVKAAGIAVDEQLLERSGRRLCEQVADTANEWRASLIVLGSHGRRGLRRMLLGSDAEQILRTAPVPVLLVRESETEIA